MIERHQLAQAVAIIERDILPAMPEGKRRGATMAVRDWMRSRLDEMPVEPADAVCWVRQVRAEGGDWRSVRLEAGPLRPDETLPEGVRIVPARLEVDGG